MHGARELAFGNMVSDGITYTETIVKLGSCDKAFISSKMKSSKDMRQFLSTADPGSLTDRIGR